MSTGFPPGRDPSLPALAQGIANLAEHTRKVELRLESIQEILRRILEELQNRPRPV